MSPEFSIAYFAHAIRSDWNNGNAHFLRGLLDNLRKLGHTVTIFEPSDGWSIHNLRTEPLGDAALAGFAATYPQLRVTSYAEGFEGRAAYWRAKLRGTDIVIVHEWNSPALAQVLLDLRVELGFRLLFHDTHHRASSSPAQIRLYGIDQFDGVLAFGESLRALYRDHFGFSNVWTLHEAADTSVFRPLAHSEKETDVVWVGNWGDDERSAEICEFLVRPARELSGVSFTVHGVRYPDSALSLLQSTGIRYAGYLPNLRGPAAYANARMTLHIPRQQYVTSMVGIPTIRVFEALACGIPLISAPWEDTEHLFREDDFIMVRNSVEMKRAICCLVREKKAAEEQALRGLETILCRHTCRHRAEQLTQICEELLQ